MPVLVDRSPVLARPTEVVVRGDRVRLRANQVIIWLTLTHPRARESNPAVRPFPVILDSGHTYSFSMQHRHLTDWAGLRPDSLPTAGHVRERGRRVPLLYANIWVHRNSPGSLDRLDDQPPYPLAADRGIAIYPPGVEFPRLPILGLRAITGNRLVLVVNGHRRQATLRTAFRWWPFAGR